MMNDRLQLGRPFWVGTLILIAVCTLVGAGSAAGPGLPDDRSPKGRDLKILVDLLGSGQDSRQTFDQLMKQGRARFTKVPEEFWDELAREIDPEDLDREIEQVYGRYFTHEEIKGMIAFYRSPIGSKYRRLRTTIEQECRRAVTQSVESSMFRAIQKTAAKTSRNHPGGKSPNQSHR